MYIQCLISKGLDVSLNRVWDGAIEERTKVKLSYIYINLDTFENGLYVHTSMFLIKTKMLKTEKAQKAQFSKDKNAVSVWTEG